MSEPSPFQPTPNQQKALWDAVIWLYKPHPISPKTFCDYMRRQFGADMVGIFGSPLKSERKDRMPIATAWLRPWLAAEKKTCVDWLKEHDLDAASVEALLHKKSYDERELTYWVRRGVSSHDTWCEPEEVELHLFKKTFEQAGFSVFLVAVFDDFLREESSRYALSTCLHVLFDHYVDRVLADLDERFKYFKSLFDGDFNAYEDNDFSEPVKHISAIWEYWPGLHLLSASRASRVFSVRHEILKRILLSIAAKEKALEEHKTKEPRLEEKLEHETKKEQLKDRLRNDKEAEGIVSRLTWEGFRVANECE